MELHLWLSLVLVCILGALSPGPSLAVVIKNTVNGSKSDGYATALSHGFGVALYALISVLGIGVLIVQSPIIFNTIQYAGAAFLVYLGIKALRAPKPDLNIKKEQGAEPTKAINGWRDGFLIAFLNPKLAIFFIALFSQFITPNASWQQQAIMVATVGIIDTLWYLMIAFGFSRGPVLNKLKNNSHVIDRIAGCVLILLAARVVTQ